MLLYYIDVDNQYGAEDIKPASQRNGKARLDQRRPYCHPRCTRCTHDVDPIRNCLARQGRRPS